MTFHRLAVVTRTGSLAIWEGDGSQSNWSHHQRREQGRWPAWHPRLDLLAASTVTTGQREIRSSIEIVDLISGGARLAYVSTADVPPVIAPRVPHYALWAPSGEHLAMVTTAAQGLTLSLSDVDGAFTGAEVAVGAPIFEAWSPEGQMLAYHCGQEMKIYYPATRGTETIATECVGFRAPAFTADGMSVVFAQPSPPGVEIVAHEVRTGRRSSIARLAGGVALSTVPDSSDIAAALTVEPDAGVFQELLLLDGSGRLPARRIVKGPFVAALWAPDGQRVAVVTPLQTGDGRYAVRVHTKDGQFLASTEGFVPAPDFRTMLGFYDQYAQSHRIWAADGSGLAVCGRVLGDGIAASFSDQGRDAVYFWEAVPGSPLHFVCPGEHAFFAWRQPAPV